mmetsp:Transcript_27178/g.44922  ORF Transcript_27178/g.44922 Transcript_27178/m.44922 type:complete len:410 (+) Transcript_27178:174-1403(+)
MKLSLILVVFCGFLPWQSSGFVGSSRIGSRSASPTSLLHLWHANKPTVQRKSTPKNALSHPTRSSWDSILKPAHHPHGHHDHITVVDKTVVAGFFGFAAVVLAKFIMSSPPGSWRYFLAGGLCAASSHAIPTPVDVIKTRKQVDPELADKSFLAAGHEIVKEDGLMSLWAGLGPTYWGYMMEGAVKFGVYEGLKPAIASLMSRLASVTFLGFFNSQLLAFSMCASVSGLAASLVLCPMEALRIRLVAEPDFAPKGWIQGGFKMMSHEGVGGFFKGINPMILKQVPYTVTKNVSFDLITKMFYSTLRQSGVAVAGAMTFTIPLVAAAIASVLSSLSSQPGDMVLSLVNAHEGDAKSRDIWRSIVRSERGVRGFFVGAKTRLLHVGVIVTIQLLIYDYVKRLCGIAATGSC